MAKNKRARDSRTGRFTTEEDAKRRPFETTVETIKRVAKVITRKNW